MISRARLTALGVAITLASGVACTQLFHSTDFQTLCDVDAAACSDAATQAPDAEAPEAGPFDFCSLSRGEAVAAAERACGLLGACAGPFGRNAAETCLVDALKAFDCTANPGLRPLGDAEAYWSCLARAKTCAEIERCVFGGPRPACTATGFLGCSASVRVDCSNSPFRGAERCAAQGRTCVRYATDSLSQCTGTLGRACTTGGCAGTHRVECTDGGTASVDIGEDCATMGAGRCAADAKGAACVPTGTAPCGATRCESTLSTGCADGRRTVLDCAAWGLTCNGSITEPDLFASCVPSVPDCTASSCASGSVSACVNRRALKIDCAALGLGPCQEVATETTGVTRPACGAPN